MNGDEWHRGHVKGGSRVKQPGGGRDTCRGGGSRLRGRGVRGIRTEHRRDGVRNLTTGKLLDNLLGQLTN